VASVSPAFSRVFCKLLNRIFQMQLDRMAAEVKERRLQQVVVAPTPLYACGQLQKGEFIGIREEGQASL
jgi:hypothetical protein